MARKNIYVPDDLLGRIDRLDDVCKAIYGRSLSALTVDFWLEIAVEIEKAAVDMPKLIVDNKELANKLKG